METVPAHPPSPAPRPRRLRRALLGVLALVALAPLGVEGWRQYDIHRAEGEWEAAALELAQPFRDVVSVREWCRERMGGSDGSTALKAALDRASHLASSRVELPDADRDEILRLLCDGGATPLHTIDALNAQNLLDQTAALEGDLRGLLKYDHLLAVPLNEPDDDPWIPGLVTAIVLCVDRALVLAWQGRKSEAAEVAVQTIEFTARQFPAAYLLTAALACSADELAHQRLGPLLAALPLTDDQLKRLDAASRDAQDRLSFTFESENLYFAWFARNGPDEDERNELRGHYSFWFGWLAHKAIDFENDTTGTERFGQAAANFRERAATYRKRAEIGARLRSGQPVADSKFISTFPFDWLREDMQKCRVWRQRTRAILAVRTQESAGTPWTDIALKTAEYSYLHCRHEDGAVVIEIRRTTEILETLGYRPGDKLGHEFAPIKMRPLAK